MRMIFPTTPTRFFDELSSDVNSLFETVLGEDAPSKADFLPRMDFEEREDAYELTLDLPGVNPDDINVEVEDDRVAIFGSRSDAKQSNEENRRRVERSFGSFRRVVRLPNPIDQDAISASSEHGVLTVTIPKVVKSARRVAVTPKTANSTDA